MKPALSITSRLTRSLTLVGGLGALLLLIIIGIEFRPTFSDAFNYLSNRAALGQVIHQLSEHVLLPMAVLIVPMVMAGRWAIATSVQPLIDAARVADAHTDDARGVRVDTTDFPTEARPFADAINRVLDRVDRAAGLHEAFAADVAHELRTPLTLLSLELERLDHPEVDRLRGDVAQMRRLIDQLMLLAQIEADRAAQLQPAAVDLADIAATVIARLAPIAFDRGARIELEADAPVVVRGRREAIAAALRNLIENALRVTPDRGLVLIRVTPDRIVAVRDEGPGLSEARLAELVERHRRADHASKHGAGLGLAIVDRIMRAHGGTLTSDAARREIRLGFPIDPAPSA